MDQDFDEKSEVIFMLIDLWKQVPELRFGQLIDNAIEFHNDRPNYGIPVKLCYVDNKRLVDIVDSYIVKVWMGEGVDESDYKPRGPYNV